MGEPDASVRISEGRVLAETLCQRCHAVGEDGASTHKEAPPFRDIAQRYPVWSLAEALAEGIVTGHPDMPAFTFEPKQIGSLLSYLDTLSKADD
jgi:cytochrome c